MADMSAISDTLSHLLTPGSFIPHGHCYLWKPGLVWLHLVSDALIALAYYSIPLTLFYFVRKRRDLPFNWIFLLFAAFIVACGTTHIAGIWTLWYPTYWLSGAIKAATALVSIFTAVELVPLVPRALALPSPDQLAQANKDLHQQIQERLKVEEALRYAQNQLEQRVQDRTAELTRANEQLQQEICDRQNTEIALRDREEQFRQLTDNIHEVFWVADPNHFKMLYISPAYETIWGRTCQSIYDTPKSWLETIHTEDRERMIQTIVRIQNGEHRFNEEYRIVRPDGEIRWIRAQTSPVANDAGQIYRMVGIAADITERKQSEAEREQLLVRERIAREQAVREVARSAEANRVKDEFLAVLSHELRTPLNPILGWTKLLRTGTLDQQKTALALETIERNAKLQTQLIEDLLDISRILQGKLTLNVCPVDLAITIEAAKETVRLAAEAKGIEIQTHLDRITGQLMGDPNRLQQVIWNLLSNAIKFTSSGGSVKVTLDYGESQVQIRVQDTGKGINPDFLPYVFDTFRQADGTTTRQFGGLGLGLAIVRQIVELHGGTVEATSPGEGLGATFTVCLPLRTASLPIPRYGRQADRRLDLQGVRVLLVDDEADTRELIAFILEQSGASVTAVASVEAALVQFLEAPPTVLLSDIGMPEEDGYSLMRQIRRLEQTRSGMTPAIALTAYAGDFDQQQALKAGFQQHLTKPVEPEKLLQAIASLIESCAYTNPG